MKNSTLFLLLIATISYAQNNPINFETGGEGANYTWTVFENDTNPALEIVDNPDPSGINTSATVAKFTALVTGQPFAGTETMHGADVGTFTLTEDNAIVKMKVYKTIISDVGFKFATPAGASTGEIKVANTVVNQWEELTFDFTAVIGEASSNGIDQIIVFPDFDSRTATTVNYFDDITFSDGTLSVGNTGHRTSVSAFPNPSSDYWTLSAASYIDLIEVYDVLGKKLIDIRPLSKNYSVDASKLSNGLYLARVTSNKSTQSLKLIKQ